MEKTELMIPAARVRQVIGQYMLADGLDVVVDFQKSRGSQIYDSKSGEFFLDFFGCFATIALGYNHPHLTCREAHEELGTVAAHKPSNSDLYSIEMAEFVDAFGRLAKPGFMKYLFFIEGGALAVENALKIAFDWKVRKNFGKGVTEEKGHQVIHFQQAFHGRSGYTLSLTNTADPNKTAYFPKFGWPRILNPKCRYPLKGRNLERVIHEEKKALEQISEVIAENPDDIAALILEPIQGEGGDNHFRAEFHRALRDICDRHEILMIYDEVQTGFGATGKMWACEHFVEPDLIAFGKKSQVCGVMAGPRVDEISDNVFHTRSRINSTWGGNLIDMVRCRLQLEAYREENVIEQVNWLGRSLMGRLHELEQEFPGLVSNARGLGLLCAIDLPNSEIRNRLIQTLFSKRLLILGCGKSSLRFRTALNIPEEDLFRGVDLIRESLFEIT